MRGSNASRKASPKKFIDSTAKAIATADGSHRHGKFSRMGSFMAVVSVCPQLGVGCCTPKPRKLRLDSVRIAPASPSVAATTTGPTTLGSIWRKMMRRVRHANGYSGGNEVPAAHAEKLAAYQPGHARPAENADYHHDVEDVGRQNRGYRDNQQKGGEAHDDIGKTHDRRCRHGRRKIRKCCPALARSRYRCRPPQARPKARRGPRRQGAPRHPGQWRPCPGCARRWAACFSTSSPWQPDRRRRQWARRQRRSQRITNIPSPIIPSLCLVNRRQNRCWTESLRGACSVSVRSTVAIACSPRPMLA